MIKGEKVRENEIEREVLKASRPKTLLMNHKSLLTVPCLGSFIDIIPSTKLPKYQNKYYYNGGKLGRDQKVKKEVKKSKE